MSIDRPSLSDLADEFQGLTPRLPFMHYAVFNWLPRQPFPVSTVTIIRNHFPCPRWPNKKPRQPALHAASCRSPDCFLCGAGSGHRTPWLGPFLRNSNVFFGRPGPAFPRIVAPHFVRFRTTAKSARGAFESQSIRRLRRPV